MPLAISFELSDRDLEHFNDAIKAAAFAAGSKTARGNHRRRRQAARGRQQGAAARLHHGAPGQARRADRHGARRGLGAAGGGPPARAVGAGRISPTRKDIIPDNVPVLGYFDDAIAIELCVRELNARARRLRRVLRIPPERGRAPRHEPGRGRPRRLAGCAPRRAAGPHAPPAATATVGTGYGSSSGYARERLHLAPGARACCASARAAVVRGRPVPPASARSRGN